MQSLSQNEYEIIEEEVTLIEETQLNEKVYNLQIADDESYFANDICVHNCRTTTVIWLESDNKVEKFELGELVEDKKKLTSYSPAEYSSIIFDIKGKAEAKGLKYNEYDLANDKKHRDMFGLNEKEFIVKANQIIQESKEILTHTFSTYDKAEKKYSQKEIQFLYFGNDGYVVVDKNFEIKGCYPHLKKGGIKKVLEKYKESRLWITLKDQN